MNSPIQEIKEKLDIIDFIRSYIPLQAAGKNFKAICPFHKEKTPSFMVSPERQTWHCFGACSEGGDIFKFLMKYENLEFYEALKFLAEKAGIELKRISPAEQKQFGVLYDINESAKDFFARQMTEKTNEGALKYLTDRGLRKETIEEFELGLAPTGFDNLTLYLINLGYDIKDIERAGLNFKTERGTYVDRFRSRIMFPIYSNFCKVVGFSGRILPQFEKPEIGKYVNSPETPIFNKSKILYGFHKSKKNIQEQKSAILVEGQMDFLMVYQDEIRNAVATSGTALTLDHLKTLRRLADQLILCFDNDEAGLKAAERSIDLASSADFNVKLLILKDCKDPAEAVQKRPGCMVNFINDAKPAMEFYFDRYLNRTQDRIGQLADAEADKNKKFELGDFKRNIRVVLAKIKSLISAVEQSHWLKELSLRTKIEEKALAEEMEQLKTRINADYTRKYAEKGLRESISYQKESACRRELIAQRLISLAIIKENFQSQMTDYLDYLPSDYLVILKSLTEQKKLEDERLNSLLNLISLRSSFESSILDEEKIDKEFQELLRQLRLECLKEKRQQLIYLIKEAEQKGDEVKTTSVLKEFYEVSKLMQN